MIKCDFKGCLSPARWTPKLMVPATGWPIDSHVPLAAICDLPLCDIHIAEITAKDMLAGDLAGTAKTKVSPLKEIFRIGAKSVGGVPPDFDRAFIRKVRLDSDEYRAFRRQVDEAKAKAPDEPKVIVK